MWNVREEQHEFCWDDHSWKGLVIRSAEGNAARCCQIGEDPVAERDVDCKIRFQPINFVLLLVRERVAT